MGFWTRSRGEISYQLEMEEALGSEYRGMEFFFVHTFK